MYNFLQKKVSKQKVNQKSETQQIYQNYDNSESELY